MTAAFPYVSLELAVKHNIHLAFWAFWADLVTFPVVAAFFSTPLITPTATVCRMSRTAKRPANQKDGFDPSMSSVFIYPYHPITDAKKMSCAITAMTLTIRKKSLGVLNARKIHPISFIKVCCCYCERFSHACFILPFLFFLFLNQNVITCTSGEKTSDTKTSLWWCIPNFSNHLVLLNSGTFLQSTANSHSEAVCIKLEKA